MEVITEKQMQSKQFNKDWESNFDFDVRFNYKFLTFLGLWPAKTSHDQKMRKCSILYTSIFLAIFVIPHGTYVLLVEPNNLKRLKMLGPFSFSLLSTGKYVFAFFNRGNFEMCVKYMSETWQNMRAEDERSIMLQAGKWTETFTKLCMTFMYISTLTYSSILPMVQQVVAVFSVNVTRRLMYPVSFAGITVVENTNQELLFDFVFLMSFISIFIMSTISIGMNTLMAKFVMHICAQIFILKKYLMLINEKEDNEDKDENPRSSIKIAVRRHLRILSFISTVEESFTGICLLEIAGSGFSTCLLGHYILSEFKKKNYVFVGIYICRLISYVIQIFIVCYLSDRLTEQCRNIGFWSYEVDWSRLYARGESTVGVPMMILASQNPPQLTAGKIFYLSMECFTTIMKAAFTYMNMLLKFL